MAPSPHRWAWRTTLLNHVPVRMDRRHANARWSLWDLLRVAIGWNEHHQHCESVPKLYQACMTHQPHTGTTRDIEGHRGTLLLLLLPSSLPLSSSPPPPLLPRNRVARKTHTSPIVARNLLRAAMGETNTVRVAIACPS